MLTCINSADSIYNADLYMQMQSNVRMATLPCSGLGSQCNARFLSKSRCVGIVTSGIVLPKVKQSGMANVTPAIPYRLRCPFV